MTRAHAIKRLLEHGPLQKESLIVIMGGDRAEAEASLGALLLSHQVYVSRGYYQLNRPRIRTQPPKKQNERFELQRVW